MYCSISLYIYFTFSFPAPLYPLIYLTLSVLLSSYSFCFYRINLLSRRILFGFVVYIMYSLETVLL